MTNTMMGSLREVQKLDERIREIERELSTFDERLGEIEDPAVALESDLKQVQDRLAQMNVDARRLERSADDKRARAEKMDQRLTRVSNLREEAAVRTELDLIKKAIEGDEQEALQLMDQIRRTEEQAEELGETADRARAEVEPKQKSLLEDRRAYDERLDALQTRRRHVLENVGDQERRVYEAFHQSGRAVVVAPLTDDGACGHCYGMIPLQLQNEIRQRADLIRCEACGVILTSEPEPVFDEELDTPLRTSAMADEAGGEVDEEAAAVEGEAPVGESEDEVDLE